MGSSGDVLPLFLRDVDRKPALQRLLEKHRSTYALSCEEQGGVEKRYEQGAVPWPP